MRRAVEGYSRVTGECSNVDRDCQRRDQQIFGRGSALKYLCAHVLDEDRMRGGGSGVPRCRARLAGIQEHRTRYRLLSHQSRSTSSIRISGTPLREGSFGFNPSPRPRLETRQRRLSISRALCGSPGKEGEREGAKRFYEGRLHSLCRPPGGPPRSPGRRPEGRFAGPRAEGSCSSSGSPRGGLPRRIRRPGCAAR